MTRNDIIELIAHHARDVIPGLDSYQFTASDSLAVLGANSVDRTEIAMLAQESLSLEIPRIELFGPKNIGELADLFLRKLSAS